MWIKPAFVPGQVLVKMAPGASLADAGAAGGLRVIRRLAVPGASEAAAGGDLYQLGLTDESTVEETVARMSGRLGVLYAEPNYVVELAGLPGDLRPDQWNLHNNGQGGGRPGADVGAAAAWALQTGGPNGEGPLVAVIDSGVDYAHPDLAANMWTNPDEIPGNGRDDDGNGYPDDVHGVNTARHTGEPMDDNGHGTHVAGIIGACGNNGIGIAGLNWTATMAAVKMTNEHGSSDAASAVASILYATSIGARITSNSWGAAGYSQALKDAMAASPALHVCAAGNSAQDNDVLPTYPASFDLPNVVAVAAHNRYDALAPFSNHGARTVHLAAPGEAITSTLPGGGYGQMSGTSMATPHVAGVAALVAAQYPGIRNDQMVARLMSSVVLAPAYAGTTISGGRVNAAAALRADNLPPAEPGGVRLAHLGSNRVALEWIAPGDDGMRGWAWRYEVRVAERPITDEQGWSDALPLALGTPTAPGAKERVNCLLPSHLPPGAAFFAVKVLDGVGNASPVATVSGNVPTPVVLFQDDPNTESGDWTMQGGWARTRAADRDGVLTDSPGGTYPADADTRLTSRPIDLRGCRNPVLTFAERHDFEMSADACRVEISVDDGRRWREVARYTGFEGWRDRVVDLGAFEGRTVRVRFRVTTDGAIQKDGIYLDEIRVSGDP
ncbi:MAG: hypothetical protein FJX76_25465 [Armatimonadetes bacterium]|nr:hypothetical protein [Armatimonadota bacterium]